MKRKWLLVVMMCIFMVVASACNSSSTSSSKSNGGESKGGQGDETYEIDIYTFSNGSSTYLFGVALAELINSNSSWLKANALESPGTFQNTQLVMSDENKRKNTIGVMAIEEAAAGFPPFKEPYDGIRALASFGLNFNAFVSINPDIKTLKDLEGKVVGIGTPPSAVRVELPKLVLEKMGIKPAKYENLAIGADIQALKDGKVDAILNGSFATDPSGAKWASNPAMTELGATDKVNYLSFDAKSMKEAIKELDELGGEPLEIPAGALGKDQTDPYVVQATMVGWYADKELPDSVAKEIVRIMAENAESFKNVHPTGAYISSETMAMLGLDKSLIHPGALEYYEEKSIDVTKSPFME